MHSLLLLPEKQPIPRDEYLFLKKTPLFFETCPTCLDRTRIGVGWEQMGVVFDMDEICHPADENICVRERTSQTLLRTQPLCKAPGLRRFQKFYPTPLFILVPNYACPGSRMGVG